MKSQVVTFYKEKLVEQVPSPNIVYGDVRIEESDQMVGEEQLEPGQLS